MGVSVDASAANADLGLAMAGGAPFMTRLAQLAAATESYQKALDDLQIGREAKEAFDAAKKDKDAAKLALDNARSESAKLVAAANIAARSKNTTADEYASATRTTADKYLADAKARAAAIEAEATEHHTAAKAASDAAAANSARLDDMVRQHEEAKAGAADAEARVRASLAWYEEKRERLTRMLAEFSKDENGGHDRLVAYSGDVPAADERI